ncbi:MAG: sigma-70 family RNA polymerase sigma factor [Anaerolineales bacterium]|nr:sigma-70 family RNA polymerase sigma factor [Anaerolineales bacterium]
MAGLGEAGDANDGELAQRAHAGDAAAYGALVERYQGAVFNVCYRMLHERAAAEDLAQEAFLRAHARLELYDTARPFGPWIKRVAANLCLNHLEGQRPSLPLDEERDAPDPDPLGQDPAAVQEAAEAAAAVRAAIAGLPPHYRVVIELRHFQDLSYSEIAAALGKPVSDVKSHLFRARKLLADALAQQRG